MKQIIYRSQPFGFDKAMLAGILMQARRNNPALGITGALICRRDMYIQLIEGPGAAIDGLYDRICEDDRHANVQMLLSAPTETRMFADWAMLDDTMPSMTFSQEEADGGKLDKAAPDALRGVFEAIAAKASQTGGH